MKKVSEVKKKRNSNTARWKRKAHAEGRCITCGLSNDRLPRTLCSKCNQKKRENVHAFLLARKLRVLKHYGEICVCCGENEALFLSIDHINNDGNKEILSGYHFYRKLEKAKFPPGFRVLCHNCNLGRHLNGGICPHVK